MAIHIDSLASSVAQLLTNLSSGIKDGKTCGLVVQSSETTLQISGEIIFNGDVTQQVAKNEMLNNKLVTTTSPKQVTQVGTHNYNEQVDDGGIVNGVNGVTLSLENTYGQLGR